MPPPRLGSPGMDATRHPCAPPNRLFVAAALPGPARGLAGARRRGPGRAHGRAGGARGPPARHARLPRPGSVVGRPGARRGGQGGRSRGPRSASPSAASAPGRAPRGHGSWPSSWTIPTGGLAERARRVREAVDPRPREGPRTAPRCGRTSRWCSLGRPARLGPLQAPAGREQVFDISRGALYDSHQSPEGPRAIGSSSRWSSHPARKEAPVEKHEALGSAVAQIERQFGKGAIMRMGDTADGRGGGRADGRAGARHRPRHRRASRAAASSRSSARRAPARRRSLYHVIAQAQKPRRPLRVHRRRARDGPQLRQADRRRRRRAAAVASRTTASRRSRSPTCWSAPPPSTWSRSTRSRPWCRRPRSRARWATPTSACRPG